MHQVAFFRNMNLGQARSRSPRSSDLVDAFTAAGASGVVNFQTNGTVIFQGDQPQRIAAEVVRLLTGVTGYNDLVVVRTADWLVALADRLDPDLPAAEVTLYDDPALPRLDLPHVERVRSGALTIVHLDEQHAITSIAGSGISAGPVLTGLVGVPVTCRGVPTMIRLGKRLGALPGD